MGQDSNSGNAQAAANRTFRLKRSPGFYNVVTGIGKPLIGWYYDLRCEGRELIPESGPVFLAMKHINIFDIMAVAVSVERQLNTLQKVELTENPMLEYLLEKAGAIPIDRDDTLSAISREAVSYSKWLLNHDEAVALFPEMTRIIGYVGKLHPDLITHYSRRVREVPTFSVGIWYDDPINWTRRGNRVEIRIEKADMSGGSLEEIADSMGKQMARLSRVEYHPELSPKYLNKKGVLGG